MNRYTTFVSKNRLINKFKDVERAIVIADNTEDKLALLPLIESIQDLKKVLRRLEKVCNLKYNEALVRADKESKD